MIPPFVLGKIPKAFASSTAQLCYNFPMLNFFKKEAKETKDPQAYIFIGRSGSGKGTQAELLIRKIEESGVKTLHVETGAFFREFIKRNLYTDVLAKKVVESGGLMPEAIAINMWVSYLVN